MAVSEAERGSLTPGKGTRPQEKERYMNQVWQSRENGGGGDGFTE